MKIDHQEWLRKRGLLPGQIKARKSSNSNWKKEYSDSLKVDRSTANYEKKNLPPVCSCPDRSIMSNLHKESEATRKAILEKARRTAPLYSKGPYQLISDNENFTTLGKKI